MSPKRYRTASPRATDPFKSRRRRDKTLIKSEDLDPPDRVAKVHCSPLLDRPRAVSGVLVSLNRRVKDEPSSPPEVHEDRVAATTRARLRNLADPLPADGTQSFTCVNGLMQHDIEARSMRPGTRVPLADVDPGLPCQAPREAPSCNGRSRSRLRRMQPLSDRFALQSQRESCASSSARSSDGLRLARLGVRN